MPVLTRRFLLAATATLPLSRPILASTESAEARLGEVLEATGSGALLRGTQEMALDPGAALIEGDTARTTETGLALLHLNERTRINLGVSSEIELASFLSEVGGVINVGGAMVFDRPDDLPPLDLRVVTAFGEIGVRGTRFFVGPSNGEYAVFVQRGEVAVSNAGVSRILAAGDGCAMIEGSAPGDVTQWGAARIEAAFASLGTTPSGDG